MRPAGCDLVAIIFADHELSRRLERAKAQAGKEFTQTRADSRQTVILTVHSNEVVRMFSKSFRSKLKFGPMSLLLVAELLAFFPVQALGQSGSPDAPVVPLKEAVGQPAFEVASVRQSPPDHGYTSISDYGTNRFTARNASLALLIAIAYNVDSNKLLGGPGWLESQLYDISAKAEGEVALTREQMLPLLRQLLEQRFHLTTHLAKQETSGYVLVVAKGGPKLQENKGAPEQAYIFSNSLNLQRVSMATFASTLEKPAGRPVIDRTGLTGKYDIKIEYAPEGSAESTLPSVFTVLQDQLGLKLEPHKVSIEMLVIVHVERVPTEN